MSRFGLTEERPSAVALAGNPATRGCYEHELLDRLYCDETQAFCWCELLENTYVALFPHYGYKVCISTDCITKMDAERVTDLDEDVRRAR